MNNSMQVFESEEFGKLNILMIDDKPYFPATECATVLGYTNPHKAIRDHCKGVNESFSPSAGGTQRKNYIPEGDLYRLIVRSNLPSAERFEKWVFDDVLPTIRKDGGYVVNGREIEALIAIFPFLTNDTRASIVRDMYVENEKLNHTIEMQKPMVKFAEMVSNSSDTIEVGQLAKLAYDENIPIGRNGLFEWLRKNKILRKNNEPYQEFLREGWFEYIERPVKTPYGVKITFKTMVRGKGQIAIVEMLRREFGVNAS